MDSRQGYDFWLFLFVRRLKEQLKEWYSQWLFFWPWLVLNKCTLCMPVRDWIAWLAILAHWKKNSVLCDFSLIAIFAKHFLSKVLIEAIIHGQAVQIFAPISVHWNNVLPFLAVFLTGKHGTLSQPEACEFLGTDDQVLIVNHMHSLLNAYSSLCRHSMESLLCRGEPSNSFGSAVRRRRASFIVENDGLKWTPHFCVGIVCFGLMRFFLLRLL